MARGRAATTVDEDEDFDIQGTSTMRPDLEDGEEYKRILKWDELADEGDAVLFTIVDPEGPTIDFGNGDQVPVVARVIVLTGEDAGGVYENQLIIKGGLKNKLTGQPAGKHVVGRVGWYEIPGRRDPYIGLEDEKRRDLELAKRALAKFGKVDMSAYDPDALRDEVEEALEAKNGGAKTAKKSSRSSSNGSSRANGNGGSSRGRGKRVVDEDDSDEPPF